MALTKSQVRNWVELVEVKALDSVNAKYVKEVTKEQERILEETGIKNVISEISKVSDELLVLRENLHSLVKESGGQVMYYDSGYNSLTRVFDTIGDFNKSFKEKADISNSTIQKIDKDFQEKIRLVKANYASVKTEVMKHTPAKSIEYLKNLGFDTTSLVAKEPKQEIAVAVDTRYLFVCGDNK